MTRDGQNALLRKKSFYGEHQKKLHKDRRKLSAVKCRSMTLVSRNIRYIRGYSLGLLGKGASNDSRVVEVA